LQEETMKNMCQIDIKYSIKIASKSSQNCSPLLHYRFANRANSCGNAIAKPQALLHTGKERDSETGFSYFGARYYDSDILTGWLSVDPMADSFLYVRHSAINKSH
jgi:RHS repeat-associated protein